MITGLRFLCVNSRQDRTAGIARLFHFPVFTVKIRFKSVLNPVFPDIRVIGILKKRILFKLFLGHQPYIAKQMGSIIRIVISDIRTGNLNACQLIFHNGGNQPHAGILYENIIRGIDCIAHIDGIPDSGNQPHLLRRVAVINIVARTHICHKFNRSRIVRQIGTFILKVSVQHRPLDFRHIRVVLKGRFIGNRKIVCVVISIAAYHIHQLKDNAVGIFTGKQLRYINFDIVAFLVADKNTSVTVKYISSCSSNGFRLFNEFVALIVILFTLYNLQLIQKDKIDRNDNEKYDQQSSNSARFYYLIHPNPLLNPPGRREISQNSRRNRPERL